MNDQIGNYQEKDREAGAANYEWKYFTPKDGPKSALMQIMDTSLAEVKERRGAFEASMVEGLTQTRFLLAGAPERLAEAFARVQARIVSAVFEQVWPGDTAKMRELMKESDAISKKMLGALTK